MQNRAASFSGLVPEPQPPTPVAPPARRALVALLGGATAIGVAPILVRLSEVGPTATAFWRLALALPVLWLWMSATERQRVARAGARASRWPLLASGLFLAGDLGVWHQSIRFTSVANATLLANLAPVFVAIASWLLLGTRITGLFLAGMALAMTGVALLVGQSAGGGDASTLGDALGVVTAVFYAGYLLAVQRLRARFSTATLMAYNALITALVLLPITLLSRERLLPDSLAGWGVLWGLALGSHVGGQGLITYALAYLPATFSSVTLLLQPVLAALFAWLLLGEALGPWQAVGGAVVLAGIVLARRGEAGG